SAAGVPFEIVPGVSSAIAVPAYAGIPVTDRDHAHSFMVIAGSRSHDLKSPEWQAASALARAGGTVIVLMGVARIQAIAEHLVAGGCSPDLPLAIISKGTYLIQDCRIGTLSNIPHGVESIKAPATIVIGNVVSLRRQMQWIELATPTAD
ncbi:MAG TPA: SAM-dependent methyltransferase, partial [Terriglobia bacterium]|nr:SAM-dependent methyltransferase [Terriglobia bacterium]